MKKIIHQISTNLLEKVDSSTNNYTVNALATAGYPNVLIEELNNLVNSYIQQERAMWDKKWIDNSNKEVQLAWNNFLNKALNNIVIPKDELEKLTLEGVNRVLELLVEPRKNLVNRYFEQKDRLSLGEIDQKNKTISIYTYLGLAVYRYMQKRNLKEIDKSRFIELIHAIDDKKIHNYEPKDWADLLEPLFSFCGNEVPASLIKQFLADKNESDLSAKFTGINDSISSEQFIEILNAPIRENIDDSSENVTDPEPEKDVKNESDSSGEDEFIAKVKAILDENSEDIIASEPEDTDEDKTTSRDDEDFFAELKAALEADEETEPENYVEDKEEPLSEGEFLAALKNILNNDNDSDENTEQIPDTETSDESEDLTDAETENSDQNTNENDEENSLHDLFVADEVDSEDEEDDTPIIFPAANQDEIEPENRGDEHQNKEDASDKNDELSELEIDNDSVNSDEDILEVDALSDEKAQISSLSDLVAEDDEAEDKEDFNNEALPMWARFVQDDADDENNDTIFEHEESENTENTPPSNQEELDDIEEDKDDIKADFKPQNPDETDNATSLADLYYSGDELEDESETEIFLEDDLIIDETHIYDTNEPSLQEFLSGKSNIFIQEIFEGDNEDYKHIIHHLNQFDNWQDASSYVQKEIILKRNTDLFAETTIEFIDLLQSYFKR